MEVSKWEESTKLMKRKGLTESHQNAATTGYIVDSRSGHIEANGLHQAPSMHDDSRLREG